MTIIVVPGSAGTSIEYERRPIYGLSAWDPRYGPPPKWTKYDFIPVSTWSHGWPLEYLRRPYVGKGFLIEFDGLPVSWSSSSAWQVFGKAYAFSPLKLLADALIGITIVVVTVAACESWRRRRRGYRFSLFDAGILATAVCATLGWWQYHVRARASERSILGDMRARAVSNYQGPDWLRRLVGNPYLIPFCEHVDALYLESRLLTADDFRDIRRLTNLKTVHCTDQLDRELIDSLAALPRLKALDGHLWAYNGIPPGPLIESADLPQLTQQLSHLRSLKLGWSRIQPEDLRYLADMRQLETLQLANPELLIEDLEVLKSCRKLKWLDPHVSATNDERRSFETAHPNWRIDWGGEPTLSWDVASVLFARWHREEGVAEGPYFPPGYLDFTKIRLTKDRLQKLPPSIFAEVESVALGRVDSVSTAAELIGRCKNLDSLDAAYVPLSFRDLDGLVLGNDSVLDLQHGPMTVDDFRALLQRLKLQTLSIYQSTFSIEEAWRIQSASNDTAVDVYRGPSDDPGESIFTDVESTDAEPSPFDVFE